MHSSDYAHSLSAVAVCRGLSDEWLLTQLVLGLLAALVSTASRFPGGGRLEEESRPSVEASITMWSPFYEGGGPNIFSSMRFPEFNTYVGNQIRCVIPDTWLHLTMPSDYGSAS